MWPQGLEGSSPSSRICFTLREPLVKKKPALIAAIALLAAIGTLAALKMCQAVDQDLFWQLKDGGRIVREWKLPVREEYSFTASGREMVATEWLAEASSYIIFSFAGYGGLVLFNTALFALTFALLLALIRRSLPLVESLCLISVAAFAFLNFYAVRAQNWTFLFTALFLYWAALWENGDQRVLWRMAVVLWPWANLHGGFMLGWAILALLCLKRFGQTRRWGTLAPWGLASVLCCAHPNGVTALLYPLWFMAAPPAGRSMILEWRPVNFGEITATPYLLILAGLLWLGLGGIAGIFPWGALTLLLAVLAFRGRKLLPEFTISALAAISLRIGASPAKSFKWMLKAAGVVSLVMTAWVVLSRAQSISLDFDRASA